MQRVLLVLEDYRELVYLQTLLKKVGFDVDAIQSSRNYEESRLTFNPQVVIANVKTAKVNGIEIAKKNRKSRTGGVRLILIVPTGVLKDFKNAPGSGIDGLIESPVNAQRLIEMIADLCQLDKDSLVDKYTKIRTQLKKEPAMDDDTVTQSVQGNFEKEDDHQNITGQFGSEESTYVQGGNAKEELQSILSSDSGDFESTDVTGDISGENKEHVSSNLTDVDEVQNQKNGISSGSQDSHSANSNSGELGEGFRPNNKETTATERIERYKKYLEGLEEPKQQKLDKKAVQKYNKKIRSDKSENLEDLDDQRRDFVRALFKKD